MEWVLKLLEMVYIGDLREGRDLFDMPIKN